MNTGSYENFIMKQVFYYTNQAIILCLASTKKSLLDYMKQDILSLGGVMHKAQEIYWKLYKIDIESKITLSSLALSIFRLKYYDVSNFPIHIPNKNEDTVIRRAYYGGHTDTYKPYSEFKDKHASS